MPKRLNEFNTLGLILVLIGVLVVAPFVKRMFPGVIREAFLSQEEKDTLNFLSQFTGKSGAVCRDDGDCENSKCYDYDKKTNKFGKCYAESDFTREANAACRKNNDCNSIDCQGQDLKKNILGKCIPIPPGNSNLRSAGMTCLVHKDCKEDHRCRIRVNPDTWQIIDGICAPQNENLMYADAVKKYGPVRR